MMTYLMLWSHILPLRLLLRYVMFAERSPCALQWALHIVFKLKHRVMLST
jgi:hypothetical protein